jgi:hypothetical protein
MQCIDRFHMAYVLSYVHTNSFSSRFCIVLSLRGRLFGFGGGDEKWKIPQTQRACHALFSVHKGIKNNGLIYFIFY